MTESIASPESGMAPGVTPTRPETAIDVADEPRTITVPRFHVVLLDDDDHTYEYVIEMLVAIFGHPERKAFDLACRVDRDGRVVVDTTTKERAELKRDQIRAYGPDPRIAHSRGSMGATVEPAD